MTGVCYLICSIKSLNALTKLHPVSLNAGRLMQLYERLQFLAVFRHESYKMWSKVVCQLTAHSSDIVTWVLAVVYKTMQIVLHGCSSSLLRRHFTLYFNCNEKIKLFTARQQGRKKQITRQSLMILRPGFSIAS